MEAAVSDARGSLGVVAVVEELHVRLLDADRREDAEIRGAALQRLIRDSSIPGDDLEVRVLNGWVTLTGDVDVQLQSDIAFDHVAGLPGVTGVTNEIEVGRARRTRDRLTEMVVPDSRSSRRRPR